MVPAFASQILCSRPVSCTSSQIDPSLLAGGANPLSNTPAADALLRGFVEAAMQQRTATTSLPRCPLAQQRGGLSSIQAAMPPGMDVGTRLAVQSGISMQPSRPQPQLSSTAVAASLHHPSGTPASSSSSGRELMALSSSSAAKATAASEGVTSMSLMQWLARPEREVQPKESFWIFCKVWG